MAGLVQRLAFPLSGRTSANAGLYANTTAAFDYALAGLPFLSAADHDHPLLRSLAPVKKDQFDAAREPGEQSLVGWWLRAQSTFIGGEGMLYQDPDLVNVANLQSRHAIQYWHGAGVNPWTPNKLTLLRGTSQRIADGTTNSHFVLGWNNGSDNYWSAVGNVLRSDSGTTTTTITYGGSGTILSLTSDGTNYYAADSVSIWKGAGTGAGAAAWNTGSSAVALGWVKGRLMAGIANKVYELVGGSPPTLPTPRFTHLNASFVWTAFAEGTNSIYAAGNAGSQGAIYKFVLDSQGNVPTLASGGILTAQLPLGETVLSMMTYLGSFIGIGTNRGFRVGAIDTNGDIQYGPLLITSGPVNSVAAYDRFFFCSASNGIDGQSGLYRVDLGQPVQINTQSSGLRFAYATDLQAHVTGTVSSVTNFGNSNRMVFAVVQQGAYLENAANLEPSGYYQSGRIRFNTMEPKLFKFLTVRNQTIRGSLAASVIDPGGATTSIMSITEGGNAALTNVSLAAPSSVAEFMQLQLNFTASGVDPTTGPEVNAWQLKALPGSVRPRVFTIPLFCFDIEQDKNGQITGYAGRTLARLEQFEQVAQKGDAVNFQSLAEGKSYLVLIEDFEFRQMAPPGPNQQGYGGILTVQMRTVADAVM